MVAGFKWLTGDGVKAEANFEVQKSDDEWRRILSSA